MSRIGAVYLVALVVVAGALVNLVLEVRRKPLSELPTQRTVASFAVVVLAVVAVGFAVTLQVFSGG